MELQVCRTWWILFSVQWEVWRVWNKGVLWSDLQFYMLLSALVEPWLKEVRRESEKPTKSLRGQGNNDKKLD